MPHKSHRGVHLSPWQCTSSHACHAKATGGQCTLSYGCHAKVTGRAAETKGRQGVHSTPCRAPSAAPPTQKPRQSAGDQETPGRTSDPLQSTKSRACHAKATGRAAETKGCQGVHPTPCRAPSAAPATQKPPAERRRPRDARAYIRPLAEHQHAAPATEERRAAETPCRAPSAAPATQKPPAERRRPRDARA